MFLLSDYVSFGVGMAFLGPTTVLPSLIRLLGGSPVAVGVLGAIQSGGWLLPQLLAGRHLAKRSRVKGYVVATAVFSRASLALLVPALWYLAVPFPAVAIGAIMAAVAAFNVGDALASVGWFDLVAKGIPQERRGRVMGAAQSISNLLAIGAGVLVKEILARPDPFPASHTLLILLAAISFGLSVLALALISEPAGAGQSAEQTPWREYLPRLAAILRRDPRFAWLTALRWLAGLADMGGAFYVLFAAERLHLPEAIIGLFISAGVVGGLFCGIILGPLSDRKGTVLAMTIIVALRCAVPVLALLAPLLAGWQAWLVPGVFMLIFALMGMANSAYLVGFLKYLLEIAPPGERMPYIAFSNTLGGALMVAPLIAGWLVQVASYELLFAVCLGLGLAGLVVALRGPGRATLQAADGSAAQ